MQAWLRRIGYRPYLSGIGLNAECTGKATQRLIGTVERAYEDTGMPVRMVGHSLGGLIARRVCLERANTVSQLIYLGSPHQAVHAHPAVTATAAFIRLALSTVAVERPDCLADRCGCDFLQSMSRPLPAAISHAAIYTKNDGVVDWHDALETDPGLNYEVGGTHTGLVYNPRAYMALAGLLAESQELSRVA
jgi:pimeloyl-ACP methyl ester carboxylesterase